mmetsp:Transcript_55839/g.132503  ORF Transcript_55839/g.132503 Transcript_55839/m.132503 type:complete len:528 (+) Transcript_55839:265-1848(+)|eukprot:CAMPEP_0180141158 /NCGR_PEP_ID=MMETSP0986-20121125/14709_1 /TAXON_ID=697907 /ORGANISM="non described non described, Strain CCMP2293" /LENGTH=527 /DNA_ID=CAMNT_0022083893 /DNA_START=264 /DNA_END=1847 /DNA_ORIENTATION=+
MAHPLELAEPNVIDEDLIRNCITTVEEMSLPDEKKKEMKTETELHDIKALSFSFQNILKIDNLAGLHSLVKLQLDNNIIEKIENIDHLVNLEWLDLSFNNIQHIQGLATLTKLTDLSLFNNRIEKLKDLHTLSNLQCLSVGHNLIAEVVHAIMYLRPFHNLRMLNMAGNPCSRDPEYYTRIIAHLKDIVYVDYRLVEPEKVQAAREQYQDELFEILEEEKKTAEDLALADKQAGYKESLKDANLEGVDTLLQDMLEEDPEQSKLQQLSFWYEIIDEMQLEFKSTSTEYIEATIAANVNKTTERERFVKMLGSSRSKNDSDSIELVRKFEAKKKKLLRSLEDLGELEAIKKLRELQDANVQLNDDLLELELRQMEADDQIISAFETRFGGLVTLFVEAAQNGFFQKVRDLEGSFHEKALGMTQEELESYAAGSLEDVGEETKIFLSDKDIVLVSLNTSHDAHLAKIDSVEDGMVTGERKSFQSFVQNARDSSAQRDRRRISEVGTITAKNNREIEELIQLEQEGGGYS